MLVEVMVGAVVLAIVTTALLNGIDGAQSQGTHEQGALDRRGARRAGPGAHARAAGGDARGVLAPASRTVTRSRRRLHGRLERRLGDRPGRPISCSEQLQDRDEPEDHLRGHLQRHEAARRPGQPRHAARRGTFSPGQGRGIVKVNRADGTAVASGSGVSLIGTSTYTAATNSLGCAVFPFVPRATYTASVGGRRSWTGRAYSPVDEGADRDRGHLHDHEPRDGHVGGDPGDLRHAS